MQHQMISNWVRQARYKSKKYNIFCSISVAEVLRMIEDYQGKCAYCGDSDYETFDHPFPLKENVPCTTANILPTCKKCKGIKKNKDLVALFLTNKISKDIYMAILQRLFKEPHGIKVKEHVKRLTGHNE